MLAALFIQISLASMQILLDYLVDCSSMLLRQEIISDIIADSQNLDIGLQEAAVRYQQGNGMLTGCLSTCTAITSM